MSEIVRINNEEFSEADYPEYYALVTKQIGPFTDFNRDVIEPNTNDEVPDGVVMVRNDDDFWIIANLPYNLYKGKTIQEIVAEFWPDVKDPQFHPDSGDPWWDEFWETAPVIKQIG